MELSSFLTINAGVPQGSKIGPFSFITKINRLPKVEVTDNSTNTESVSMFINHTKLFEILNVANSESNQPIGNIELTILL